MNRAGVEPLAELIVKQVNQAVEHMHFTRLALHTLMSASDRQLALIAGLQAQVQALRSPEPAPEAPGRRSPASAGGRDRAEQDPSELASSSAGAASAAGSCSVSPGGAS